MGLTLVRRLAGDHEHTSVHWFSLLGWMNWIDASWSGGLPLGNRVAVGCCRRRGVVRRPSSASSALPIGAALGWTSNTSDITRLYQSISGLARKRAGGASRSIRDVPSQGKLIPPAHHRDHHHLWPARQVQRPRKVAAHAPLKREGPPGRAGSDGMRLHRVFRHQHQFGGKVSRESSATPTTSTNP